MTYCFSRNHKKYTRHTKIFPKILTVQKRQFWVQEVFLWIWWIHAKFWWVKPFCSVCLPERKELVNSCCISPNSGGHILTILIYIILHIIVDNQNITCTISLTQYLSHRHWPPFGQTWWAADKVNITLLFLFFWTMLFSLSSYIIIWL